MSSKQSHKTRSRKTYRERMRLARYYVGGYTMPVKLWRLFSGRQFGRYMNNP